ncbi:MAG: outer membrane lipoprotein carrier protein LolA [Vicingaceae bacterium]|nr:outer membrane lipoprotein carrier protein LolA [Vicingaceae bacterium]
MKSLLILFIAAATSLTALAQEDTKAKGILDKLSTKTKAYKTIKADFQFTISNKAEGTNESQSGKIVIKGDKYVLSISGQDVISDGKSMWTILKESKEVQINEIDEEDEEAISPNKIFTLYEEGFKYKYVKEDKGMHIINLYPKAAAEKSFHRIALYINKAKNEMSKVKVYGKDGTITTYSIKSFTPNTTIPETRFSFSKSKFPSYEIIDLR